MQGHTLYIIKQNWIQHHPAITFDVSYYWRLTLRSVFNCWIECDPHPLPLLPAKNSTLHLLHFKMSMHTHTLFFLWFWTLNWSPTSHCTALESAELRHRWKTSWTVPHKAWRVWSSVWTKWLQRQKLHGPLEFYMLRRNQLKLFWMFLLQVSRGATSPTRKSLRIN